MTSSWAKGTQTSYNVYLNKWMAYCENEKINPHSCNFEHGIKFLSQLYKEGAKYGYIAAARSALSAVLKKEEGLTFGKDPRVSKFIKGVYRLKPQLPRYTEIYDPDIILNYVERLPNNEQLMFEPLVKKLATLIMLLSGQRGQAMPLLRIDCMSRSKDTYTFFIPEPLKQTKPGHHQEPLRFERYPEKKKLCVSNCLDEYLQRTENIRENLEGKPKELFLSYVYPHNPVGKSTITRYIKTFLSESGIDITVYANHSLRKASTSKANNMGLTIKDIQKAAGWKSKSIFRECYKLPIKENFGSKILGQ